MPPITRRRFCWSASALLPLPARAAADNRLILVTVEQSRRMREMLGPTADVVRANADAALAAGPWSVTTRRPKDVTAGPND